MNRLEYNNKVLKNDEYCNNLKKYTSLYASIEKSIPRGYKNELVAAINQDMAKTIANDDRRIANRAKIIPIE